MSTLDDLRHIIRRIEGARPPRPAAEPVETVLGGQVVDTGAGRLLVVRREYPLSYRHGRCLLGDGFEASPEVLKLVASGGEEPDDAGRLLFLDTETTGLAGGTGTYAFLVGTGHLEGAAFVVTQYFMRDFDDEPALLAALAPRLERTTGIVSFNGTGFDLPLLETRFVLARHRWPDTLPQIDLLRPARRVWAWGFPDCRLGTVEREALGLARADEVPGALIPTLYFQFLRTRRAQPLARVFAHNRDDVLSLVALLGWFAQAVGGGFELTPEERVGVGRLWERLDPERGMVCYREALRAGLGGIAGRWAGLRLAAWEKRREQWQSACALWEAAARSTPFDPRPWEELAKFHEHRARDLFTAHRIVTDALTRALAASAPPRTVEALTHRLGRLHRRLGAAR